MKPLLVFLEVAGPFQLRPGYYCADFKNVKFRRIWWLWFAFAWIPMDLKEYTEWIDGEHTAWVD